MPSWRSWRAARCLTKAVAVSSFNIVLDLLCHCCVFCCLHRQTDKPLQSGLDKLHGGLKAKIVIFPLVSCQFHIYCYVNVVIVPSQYSSINFPGW